MKTFHVIDANGAKHVVKGEKFSLLGEGLLLVTVADQPRALFADRTWILVKEVDEE